MPFSRSQTWKAMLANIAVFALLVICVSGPVHGHADSRSDSKDACIVCQCHHSPAAMDHGVPQVLPPAPSHSAAITHPEPLARLAYSSVSYGRAPPSFA